MNSEKIGLLLINVGTPASPRVEDVRNYLAEFLMDGEVIDLPWLMRWGLVHGFILKDRPEASANQYSQVWTEKGSPLMQHTLNFRDSLEQAKANRWVVEIAMRYGSPKIEDAIAKLAAAQIDKLIVFPLYPQYSTAATRSALTKVEACLKKLRKPIPHFNVPAFYNDPAYLDAVAQVSRKYLGTAKFDYSLFSFHGLPERQIKKLDHSGNHCFQSEECCNVIGAANADCYRAQCFYTANELAKRLGLQKDKYQVCFQSRLGRTQWVRPYTDLFYRELPKKGVKRIAVFCPSFVADCLETVEEVSIRGKEEFLRNGGEELFLVPSLNAEHEWVQAVLKIANQLVA